MKAPTYGMLALAAGAPTTATVAGFELTGEIAVALVTGGLATVIVIVLGGVMVSQESIRVWIRCRPEILRTNYEGRALKKTAIAAVSGPSRKANDAERKRRDARLFAREIGLRKRGISA
ncbi:hypothetical protein OG713_22885 [Streptomyces sp. NBC_00723]|jgi:hypothetical protein|uniref:hypothetical protein n=1 Tax=Streptomyces sp. NBC_00723 TaxID=2903673 RepID=UPI003865E9EA